MVQQIKDNSISGKTVITNTADRVVVPGFADMIGLGTLALTGSALLNLAIPMTGTGTLTLTGDGLLSRTAHMVGTGTLGLSGTASLSVIVPLSATGSLTLTGSGLMSVGRPLTGLGSLGLTGRGQLSVPIELTGTGNLTGALVGRAAMGRPDPFFGEGYPGGLSLPSGLRIRMDIANNGELVDVSDIVDRTKITMERTNTPGSSTATIELLSDIGAFYDIYDTSRIFIDTDDPTALAFAWPVGWPNTGAFMRMFMGRTIAPDSTKVTAGERVITMQAVDNTWLEKFPPMNAGLPYPPNGTPFVNTVLTESITPGPGITVIPFRMQNITPGRLLEVADVTSGYVEYVNVATVNYPGQMIVTTPILASGVHTVAVPSTAGITVGEPYHIYNVSDGTHYETIYPTAVGSGTITALFANSHKGSWAFMAGSFVCDFDFAHPAYETSSTLNISTFASLQHIPVGDLSFIEPGMALSLSNADGSYYEVVDVISVDTGAGTFDAIVAWPKRVIGASPWKVQAFPALIGGIPDDVLLAGEWVQDVDQIQTTIGGILYTFYDDSQSTPVAVARPTPGNYDVNPTDMSNIFPGRTVLCTNADGSNRERCLIHSVGPTTLNIDLTKPKDAGWLVFNGPYIDKSSVNRIVPSVALAGSVRSSQGSVTYQGKNIAQLFSEIEAQASDVQTIVDLPASVGSLQTVIPRNMYGFFQSQIGKQYWAQNADGSHGEYITMRSASRTHFQADITLSKSAGWRIFGKVQPQHCWSFNQDTPDHLAPWLPVYQYFDSDVRTNLAFRILTDGTVVDPSTGAQYGTYKIKRDGNQHFNAVQVIGQNNSWARYVDYDAINGLHGVGGDKQIMEGPVQVRQDCYTDDECYEAGAAIVSDHNFCQEIPTLELDAMASPDLFHNPVSVTLIAFGEPGYNDPGKTLPVERVRLTTADGTAHYTLELGQAPHEGIAHAIAGFLGNQPGGSPRIWDPPYQQTRVLTSDGTAPRSAASYHVDTTSVSDNTNLPRTIALPDASSDPTYHSTVLHATLDGKKLHIIGQDGSLIDFKSGLDMPPGGGPYHIYSDGRNYHTVQGWKNPHNVNTDVGDPFHLTGPQTPDNPDGDTKFSIYHSSGSAESVTMDFTGIDPVNGQAYIQGPNSQIIQMDAKGTGIYDTMQFGATNARTSDHNIAVTDRQTYFPVDCSGGAKNLNLPQVNTNQVYQGTTWIATKSDNTANPLNIVPFGTETINGVNAPYIVTSRGYVLISLQKGADASYFWEVQALGAGKNGRVISMDWNVLGTAPTVDTQHWMTPVDCTIIRAVCALKSGGALTTFVPRIRMSQDTLYPYEWNAGFIDDGNLALAPGTRATRSGPDLDGWVVDIPARTFLRVEITGADPHSTGVLIVLELQEKT